ncbi:MAG TPA: class I SAM-dependent methyltransferase [Acidimicrobiales bacterium]|nr:class I SAM-dependent methyltransferase [Acidimicrobiales bacterium]
MAELTRNDFVDPAIVTYAEGRLTPPDPVQEALRTATRERVAGHAGMQIGHDQAVLMEILARAMGARRAIEIGTFTGYSALAVVRGMGPAGRLICLDVSEEWTAIAREFWARAGVAEQVDLRIGPALESLAAMADEEPFDLAFVDADKEAYGEYFDLLIERLRPGGLLLADNTLQSGRVIDPTSDRPATFAMRAFNDKVAADPRVTTVLLPIGDGVTVAQRR